MRNEALLDDSLSWTGRHDDLPAGTYVAAGVTRKGNVVPVTVTILPPVTVNSTEKNMGTTGLIECDREELLTALQIVCLAIERRNTIPILGYVLLQAKGNAVTIEGTDLDVTIRHTIARKGSKAAVAVTLPAFNLLDFVKTAAGETATIAVTMGRAKITAGAIRSLATLPVADFPYREYETPVHFGLDLAELRDAIRVVKPAISTEEVRYSLNGVFFEPTGTKDELLMTATDGHRLHHLKVRGIGLDKSAAVKVIVPAKTTYVTGKWLGYLARVWRKQEAPQLSVEMGNAGINFRCGNTAILSKISDGKFPDYQRVIPSSIKTTAHVDVDALSVSLKRVAAARNAPQQGVKFSFADNRLVLSRDNPDENKIEDSLACKFSAEPFVIKLNGGYVRDILAALGDGYVELGLNDPGSPSTWKRSDGKGPLIVLMPMRI